jgi:DNA-binding NarL/FixJ family response regulator
MSGTDSSSVRVLIADSHSLFRGAVRAALEAADGIEVVAEASDGITAVGEVERTMANVALVDSDLTGCRGAQTTYLIKERVPHCRVIFLAGMGEEEILVDAVEAGAVAFLTKECSLDDLVEAIRAVERGEMIIPQVLLAPLLSGLIRRRKEHDEALEIGSRLTKREREVLALLAQGSDNKAIAEALTMSPHTARTHIHNVLSKLGVHTRLEAAALAIRKGILGGLPAARGVK